MNNMKGWMLGAAVVAGAVGLGSAPAQAAEFGIYARGPVAYVPPCPGPGYVWVAGYMADGYWIPGRWNFAGDRERRYSFDVIRRDFDRHDQGRDRERRADRGRERDQDRFRR